MRLLQYFNRTQKSPIHSSVVLNGINIPSQRLLMRSSNKFSTFMMSLLCTAIVLMTTAIAQTAASAAKSTDPKVSANPVTKNADQTGAAKTGAKTAAKKSIGFSVTNIDKTANPCEDFYQYACGNWRKNNPIPSDQTRWGRFNELAEA